MLSDVWHLPTTCMRPSIKIVCCSLYPYRHNLVEFTLRIFHTQIFEGPFLILSALLDVAFLTVWELSSVRLSVQLLSHLLQDHWSDFFLNLVRMFPSVPSCASIKKNSGPSTNMAAVGHLWCFLLSHLLSNYLTDSNETCLLCLPQCLNVQVQKKKIPVRRQIWPFGSRLGLSEISHWQACYRISSKTTGRICF